MTTVLFIGVTILWIPYSFPWTNTWLPRLAVPLKNKPLRQNTVTTDVVNIMVITIWMKQCVMYRSSCADDDDVRKWRIRFLYCSICAFTWQWLRVKSRGNKIFNTEFKLWKLGNVICENCLKCRNHESWSCLLFPAFSQLILPCQPCSKCNKSFVYGS